MLRGHQKHELSGEAGTHLTPTRARGKVKVHVAPSRFLSDQRWQFAKGNQVEV
jgi:hypothetical protein